MNRRAWAVGLAIAAGAWAGRADGEPVLLDRCIAAALQDNPGAAAAEHRVAAARGAIMQARAAYYPALSAAGAWTRTDNPPQAFMMTLNQRRLTLDGDFNNPEDTENLRLGMELKYRLFDGGRSRLGVAMAGLGEDAEVARLEAVRNELIHRVTEAYYGVLQAQAFVGVAEETVSSLEENLRVARARFENGAAVKTDVLNLEVRLAEAREDAIKARNGQKLALAALNTAIGRPLVSPADALAAVSEAGVGAPPAVSPTDIEGRAELRLADIGARVAEKALSRSRRERVPELNAFGSWDWDSDVSADFEESYFVGLAADWSVFAGRRIEGGIAKAHAELLAARAQEAEMRNGLGLDLTQALLKAGEAWARLAVARTTVDSAEEALRMTRERYEQGAADITELLTAQVGLTATRTRHVAALYDYLSALSNIERARGALPSRYDRTSGAKTEGGG
jgi:outer membrane protein TolC